jgi:hypothetical protein
LCAVGDLNTLPELVKEELLFVLKKQKTIVEWFLP